MVSPIVRGSAPKRLRHKVSLITATCSWLCLPSSGKNTRPAIGRTPSIEKKPAVTFVTVTRVGSPAPVRLAPTVPPKAPICSKTWLPSFHVFEQIGAFGGTVGAKSSNLLKNVVAVLPRGKIRADYGGRTKPE